MKNSEQPVYPMPHQNQDGTIQHDVYFGLTKREYFAGLAMQGYCGGEFTGQSGMPVEYIAKWSVEMADALLAELDKEDKQKMSDKKKTAVEWLIEKITSRPISELSDEDIFGIFGEAKQMEVEQMEDAFDESRLTHPMVGFKHDTFDEYYQKTYGTPETPQTED